LETCSSSSSSRPPITEQKKMVQSRFAETPTLTLTLNPNFGESGFGETGFGESGRHQEDEIIIQSSSIYAQILLKVLDINRTQVSIM